MSDTLSLIAASLHQGKQPSGWPAWSCNVTSSKVTPVHATSLHVGNHANTPIEPVMVVSLAKIRSAAQLM